MATREVPSPYGLTDLPSYLPSEREGFSEAVETVRSGLPAEAFDWLKSELHLTASQLADVVHISRRTISRRKKEGWLKTDESERLLRLVRLYQRAACVLGSAEEARNWMNEPNFALGEETPLGFADTEPGARRVEQLLGQIEYGMAT